MALEKNGGFEKSSSTFQSSCKYISDKPIHDQSIQRLDLESPPTDYCCADCLDFMKLSTSSLICNQTTLTSIFCSFDT